MSCLLCSPEAPAVEQIFVPLPAPVKWRSESSHVARQTQPPVDRLVFPRKRLRPENNARFCGAAYVDESLGHVRFAFPVQGNTNSADLNRPRRQFIDARCHLLRHAIGPEPDRPGAADAPNRTVRAVRVEAMRCVVGLAEAANKGRQFDELAERVSPETEPHHGAIIA